MTANRAKYPRFARDEDMLVRIGWAASRRREYTIGRTPRYAVDALISRILDVSDPGGTFERKSVFRDLKGPELGAISEVEAKLALLWLVSSGLVRKSCNSYQVKPDVDLLNDYEKRWDRVRQKKS